MSHELLSTPPPASGGEDADLDDSLWMPTIVRSIPQAMDRPHASLPVTHQPVPVPDPVPVAEALSAPQTATPGDSVTTDQKTGPADGPAPRGGARRGARRSPRAPEATDPGGVSLAHTAAPARHRAASFALIALLVLAVLSMIGVLLATIFVLPDYLEENGFIEKMQQSQAISLSVLAGR